MSGALARHLMPSTSASVTSGAQGCPDDAADWLRAHFDWTRGAVWVACERWQVDAATVVAWAERLRAGGARAGLGARERAWIVAQLFDLEQRPTAVERAMARTRFRGLEATPPLAIRSIHDAIALLEARIADSERQGEDDDHRSDPFRALLLDDLRALRDGREDERPDEQNERHDEVTATTTTATDDDTTPAPTRDTAGYETREAHCDHCGNPFTSRKYSSGWTRYCSQRCGGKARYAAHEDDAPKPTPAAPAIQAAPADAPAPAPEPVHVPLVFAHLPGSVTDAPPMTSITIGAPRPAAEPPAEPTWPLLAALLDRLPTSGQWTTAQRERWLRAFTATLDLDVITTNDTAGEGAALRERTEA